MLLHADYLADPDIKHVHCGNDLLLGWLRLPLFLLGLTILRSTARCSFDAMLALQSGSPPPHRTAVKGSAARVNQRIHPPRQVALLVEKCPMLMQFQQQGCYWTMLSSCRIAVCVIDDYVERLALLRAVDIGYSMLPLPQPCHCISLKQDSASSAGSSTASWRLPTQAASGCNATSLARSRLLWMANHCTNECLPDSHMRDDSAAPAGEGKTTCSCMQSGWCTVGRHVN